MIAYASQAFEQPQRVVGFVLVVHTGPERFPPRVLCFHCMHLQSYVFPDASILIKELNEDKTRMRNEGTKTHDEGFFFKAETSSKPSQRASITDSSTLSL